ncbi:MAG TPA: YitT family protein [Chloroflexia bacterium]|jgi:hypothetical protein|nr:YitT family protein [Chloroflexia bacterium]
MTHPTPQRPTQTSSTLPLLANYLETYALLTLGAGMLALANDIFFIPNNVFAGGTTGLMIMINSLTGMLIGLQNDKQRRVPHGRHFVDTTQSPKETSLLPSPWL